MVRPARHAGDARSANRCQASRTQAPSTGARHTQHSEPARWSRRLEECRSAVPIVGKCHRHTHWRVVLDTGAARKPVPATPGAHPSPHPFFLETPFSASQLTTAVTNLCITLLPTTRGCSSCTPGHMLCISLVGYNLLANFGASEQRAHG